MSGVTGCVECGSTNFVDSALPGMSSCQACGKLFETPEDQAVCQNCGYPITNAAEIMAEACSNCGQPLEKPDEDEAVETSTPSELNVPSSIECVFGWRTWGVKIKRAPGAVPLLQSVSHAGAFWSPRSPMVAKCPYRTGQKSTQHEVPDENCSCGLYSAKTYEHLMSMHYHTYDADRNGLFHCVGKVKLWGKVIEGGQGWRAQIGYPDELYVPYEAWSLAEQLEDTYKIDVGLKNFLSAPAKRKTGKENPWT